MKSYVKSFDPFFPCGGRRLGSTLILLTAKAIASALCRFTSSNRSQLPSSLKGWMGLSRTMEALGAAKLMSLELA